MRFARWVFGIAAAGMMAGCSASAGSCVDRDLDSFGAHCSEGPDCDDTNPLRTDNCDTVPPPDCNADPLATGCSCPTGALRRCFTGEDGTENVGECVAGSKTCIHGHWGLCTDEVTASFERCNEIDDDCDGRTDEGVRSPCGSCDPACIGGVWGDTDAPFAEEEATGLRVDGDGAFALVREVLPWPDFVWVPSRGDGVTSRIDAVGRVEAARYATGARPSRVAVDGEGDAWVLSEGADPGASALYRIAGDVDRCEDANLDGLVTSDGPSDVKPEGEDECVLARFDVGTGTETGRALAAEVTEGAVWVGFAESGRLVRIDTTTGAELAVATRPGFSPTDATFDVLGYLWFVDSDGHLVRVDPRRDPPAVAEFDVPYACYLTEHLASDTRGHVFASGGSCNRVFDFDPVTETFDSVPVFEAPRGILATESTLWVAHAAGYLTELDVAPMRVRRTIDLAFDDRVPFDTTGVTLDRTGAAWTVGGNTGGATSVGLVSRVDVEARSVTDTVDVGLAPTVHGDFSGAARRGGFHDMGEATHVFGGCGAGTGWERIHVDALTGPFGEVAVDIRHAADVDALGAASWVSVGAIPPMRSPLGLDLPEGGVVEVRVVLRTASRDATPRLLRVGVEWTCVGPG
ncbi:MAG: hypothetical protein R3A78_08965 [Polyangiales bacterium]